MPSSYLRSLRSHRATLFSFHFARDRTSIAALTEHEINVQPRLITLMSQFGVLIGIGLLLAVTACAWLLGRRANRSVRQFRAEHHQSFLGRKDS